MNLEQCRNIWDEFMMPQLGTLLTKRRHASRSPAKEGVSKKQAGGSRMRTSRIFKEPPDSTRARPS